MSMMSDDVKLTQKKQNQNKTAVIHGVCECVISLVLHAAAAAAAHKQINATSV